MLNEIYEYIEYTRAPESNILEDRFSGRFAYQCTLDNEGLKRALTIIARYALFHCEELPNDSIPKFLSENVFLPANRCLSVEETIQLLNSWCGFDTEAVLPEGYNHLKNWYIRYMDAFSSYEKNNEDPPEDTKEKSLSKADRLALSKKIFESSMFSHKKAYNGSLFSVDADGSVNDFNTIRFKRIIAEAFLSGPLKRNVLICKKNAFWELKKKTENNNIKNLINSQRDIVSKSVVSVLLSMTEHHSKYVLFNKPEVANWLGSTKKPQDIKFYNKQKQAIYYYNEGPLFESVPLPTNNASKLKISQSWLDAFKPEIISEGNLAAWFKNHLDDLLDHQGNPKYELHMDMGSGTPLVSVDLSIKFADKTYDEIEAELKK